MRLCFIDLETTGINVLSDEPIQLGAVLVNFADQDEGEVIAEFTTYVKPTLASSLSNLGYQTHGISSDEFESFPHPSSVLENYFRELGTNYQFAAWNMSFDVSFFKALCERNSFLKDFNGIDYRHIDVQTLCFMARLMGKLPFSVRTFTDLLHHYGYSRSPRHSAIEDARLLYVVYKNLVKTIRLVV